MGGYVGESVSPYSAQISWGVREKKRLQIKYFFSEGVCQIDLSPEISPCCWKTAGILVTFDKYNHHHHRTTFCSTRINNDIAITHQETVGSIDEYAVSFSFNKSKTCLFVCLFVY